MTSHQTPQTRRVSPIGRAGGRDRQPGPQTRFGVLLLVLLAIVPTAPPGDPSYTAQDPERQPAVPSLPAAPQPPGTWLVITPSGTEPARICSSHPLPDAWLWLRWGGAATDIAEAANACPFADTFWVRRDGRWLGYHPAAREVSDFTRVGANDDALVHTFKPRTLVVGGRLTGFVRWQGAPVPDGTLVGIIVDGGPTLTTRTQQGRYELPLLAQRSADNLYWLRFVLVANGTHRAVTPTGPIMELDIEAAESPVASADAPACALMLGTVSGAVTVRGTGAPDGTAVGATIGPRTEDLAQMVLTEGGRYRLTSVGMSCDDGRRLFLEMTISALGVTLTITPQDESTHVNLFIP